MPTVRIYQQSKTAMQSGKGKTRTWVLKFESSDPMIAEPLMGWITSSDPSQQLRLIFLSLNEAIQYAKSRGFSYHVVNPTKVSSPPKAYEENFTCPHLRER